MTECPERQGQSAVHHPPSTVGPRWTWPTIILVALRPWIAVEVAPPAFVLWLSLLAACTCWHVVEDRPRAVALLRSPAARLALLLWFWTACSWCWTMDRAATLWAMVCGAEACVLVLAVWMLGAQRRQTLCVALALSALGISLLGLYQFFFGLDFTRQYLQSTHPGYLSIYHVYSILSSKRVFATFFSPDVLAGYLAAMIPLMAAWWGPSLWRRVGTAVMVIAAATCLLLTRSLGGALAIVIAVGTALAVSVTRMAPQGARARRWLWIAAGIGVIWCGVVLASRWQTFANAQDTHNPFARRLNYWSLTWRLIAQQPWWGYGAGSFAAAYGASVDAYRWPTQFAHNAWLEWWVETGLVGVLLNVTLVVWWWRRALRAVASHHLWAWGVLLSGTALLAHGLIDYDFSVNQVAFLWWVLVGWMAHDIVIS